jgi:hypothetical protein
MRVTIELSWETIGEVSLSPFGTLHFPAVPSRPGIYRFRVLNLSETEVYIGESQDLRHRMLRNYASKHKGRTYVRVREMLLQHLAKGRIIELAIVSGLILEIDGKPTTADLELKHVRLLVENAALALALQAGEQVHNL